MWSKYLQKKKKNLPLLLMRLWAQARHLSNSLTGAHRRRDPRDQYLILRCCTVMMQQKAPRSRLMKVEGRLVRAPPAKDLIRGTSCINEAFRPVRCRRPRRPKAAGDVLISGSGFHCYSSGCQRRFSFLFLFLSRPTGARFFIWESGPSISSDCWWRSISAFCLQSRTETKLCLKS